MALASEFSSPPPSRRRSVATAAGPSPAWALPARFMRPVATCCERRSSAAADGAPGPAATRCRLRRVKLVAMADVLGDRVESSLRNLLQIEELEGKIDVPPERRFTGFDGYRKAIDCGVDLVLLTTPPAFRPMQYAAAVKAGKHVFMEKPCCVDAPGVPLACRDEPRGEGQEALGRGGAPAAAPEELPRGDPPASRSGGGRRALPPHLLQHAQRHRHRRRPERMTEMEWQLRNWATSPGSRRPSRRAGGPRDRHRELGDGRPSDRG